MDYRLRGEPKSRIFLLDDLITTGAHFVGARRVLEAPFRDIVVEGLFVARRVLPEGE